MRGARLRRLAGGFVLLLLAACAGVTGLDGYIVVDALPVLDGGGEGAAAPDVDASTMDALPPPPDVAISCLDGEVATFDRCYFLNGVLQPQPVAKAACLEAGAHLVAITNADENETVSRIARGTDRWIGLESAMGDANARDTFRWVTGEAVTFDGWYPGDPNENTGCIVLGASFDASWNDRACATPYASICERP